MLIRALLARQFRLCPKSFALPLTLTRSIHSDILDSKFSHSINPSHTRMFTRANSYNFSKQKIIQEMERFNEQIDAKNASLVNSQNVKQKDNEFLEKQQKIIKDFLDLTEQSFSEHLQIQLKEKYHVDAEMLLMIIASLQDPTVIKQTITKIYPFIPIIEKKQLLLLIELIVAHRPQNLPPLSTVQPKPLEGIESILLLLSQVYPKDERMIEWLKEIPLYKGKNVCMVAAGFFAVYEKMDQHVRFKNERITNRCIDRIIDLTVDEDEQTQISIAILALESVQTSHFAQKLLIDLQTIDYDSVDPLKLQLFFIHLQRDISSRYGQTRKQLSNKNKYKILEQSEQGQVIEKQEQEYIMKQDQKLQYSQVSQIQRFKFLNNISKTVLNKIIDMNWNELMKLNLLIEYWKILETFPTAYPWNSFKNKLVNFTFEKDVIKKLTNFEHEQVLVILQVMEKLKINKSPLLMRLLAMVSQKLDILDSRQLIRLSKVCVTFVRQCEDFLISVRFEIQNRKFIFKEEQIDELNQIFKRVLVLFPRPLTK